MGEPRPKDLVILQEHDACVLMRHIGDGRDEQLGFERRPERALARLVVDAMQARVTIWFARDRRPHELLVSFRTLPPTGPRPE